MNKKVFKESFKRFYVENENGWEITWARTTGPNEVDAMHFENTTINQLLRLEEKKDGSYVVTVESDGRIKFSETFGDFVSARNFVSSYVKMKINAPSTEKVSRLKNSLKEELDTQKEDDLFIGAKKEFLRIINLVVTNNSASPKILNEAKEIQEFLTK